MQIDLSGKKAVVTGAGAGIGLAVVRALAAAGADVYGGARTVSPELKEATPHTLTVDLVTEEGPQLLVERALTEFGGIDILVNNVGGGVMLAPGFRDIPDDVWRQTFELNVMTTIRATRAALPSLVERKGTVVNIGSMNGTMADPRLAHYSAAKAAVANIGKALSAEFAAQGVRVNTISPGPVKTRLWTNPHIAEKAGMTPDEFLAMVPKMAGLATGEMIEPEEIAALVVLFASGRIRSVTGVDLPIDAGMAPPSRYQRPN
ncbi:SDR family NAD(P)-dependent oxidoreductase [Micromonospora sp. WMMD558]|uniref:SDR family NAD(P)-dependent oxidoreductase n=1 Tax=unclassified Micromonospora TaxID=2617518 RepID=UPI0012B4969A|nr:SDR family NAD(P)-dependent oxidoreductase [Micromonospora sp. WMMC415]QGN49930.1 SDR family oxidoreductase [Micromonospora sp. WMMC415]